MDPPPGLLGFDDALRIVQRLIDLSDDRGTPLGRPIVLVGGSAMAARAVRKLSEDVDLWVPSFSDQVVHDLETELTATAGSHVRIDVTSTENVWSPILLRDIADSPLVATLTSRAGVVEVRALRIEDLYLLKLAADREKDRVDLPALGARTTPEALIARFNRLVPWHGDRSAVLGLADALVTRLAVDFATNPRTAIDRLELPPFMLDALRETHVDGT